MNNNIPKTDESIIQENTSLRKIGISDFSTKPINYYNIEGKA